MVRICSVKGCRSESFTNCGISFYSFPTDEEIRNEWIRRVRMRRCNWECKNHSRICSKHFAEDSFIPNENFKWRRLKFHALPTLCLPEYITLMSEQDVQPEPGPSKPLGSRTSFDTNASRDQDPLSRVIEQCRFCGEFSKDCIPVSDNMPYLAANKATLVLNDTSVQLDFNDNSLPKTVCRECDAKLQEIADFVKVVKDAQSTLINVEAGADIEPEENRTELEPETEMLVIKTEYDSQHEDSDDDKEGIVDSLTVGETVFVKETHKSTITHKSNVTHKSKVTHKRKSDADKANPKKLKAKEKSKNDEKENSEEEELLIDIKEEVIDEHDGLADSATDTGIDVKPSELDLATSALVFEMASDGTSKFQGYGSNR